jgi:hypothetical protein
MLFLSFAILTFQYGYRRDCTSMRFCRDNFRTTTIYFLNETTISFTPTEFTANLTRPDNHSFFLLIYPLSSGGFRLRIEPLLPEPFTRFDASLDPNIINQSAIHSHNPMLHHSIHNTSVLTSGNESLEITYSPVTFRLFNSHKLLLSMNLDKRLLFENNENITVRPERYQGLRDKIPNGATSVGLDFHFNGNDTQLSGLSPRSKRFNLFDTYRQQLIRLFTIGDSVNTEFYHSLLDIHHF